MDQGKFEKLVLKDLGLLYMKVEGGFVKTKKCKCKKIFAGGSS